MGGDIEVARMIAYDAGKEDEREAIVKWLRERRTCDGRGRKMPNGEFFADAIEQSHHLQSPMKE